MDTIPGYETFKQGGNRLTIGLFNHTRETIKLKKGTQVAQVKAAHIVPKMLAPEPGTDPSVLENMMWEQTEGDVPENTKVDSSTPTPQPPKPEPTPEQLDKLFSKLDLSRQDDWDDADQQAVHDLMVEYQHLFALDDLELGCTPKVKHKIKLSNPVPFKDRYR